LPDTLKERGEEPFDPRRSELRLCPKAGGGFRLEASGGWAIETGALRDGRHAVVSSDGRRWTLREATATDAGGVVLEVAGPEGFREAARSVRGSRPGIEPLAFYLADGRVFLAAPGIGAEAGYDLHGWEVRGAYWTARRQGSCWMLSPTAAGRRLSGSEAILVLLAAEILAAGISSEA
jgi:hypothetical protein